MSAQEYHAFLHRWYYLFSDAGFHATATAISEILRREIERQ